MRVMDTKAHSALWIKALIYGASGSGKTTFACTAPDVLCLVTEAQALLHIQHAEARNGRDVFGALHMESIDDFKHVARTLRLATANPELRKGPFVIKNDAGQVLFEKATWPRTIAIDSITDACRLIEADIDARSPPQLGKDGLPARSMRFWGVLQDMVEKLLRAFRDVDFHVIFLALLDDRMQGEGEDAVRVVGPSVPMRSVPGLIAAAVNVVGVMERQMRPGKTDEKGNKPEAEIKHSVRTTGPNYMLLKPYRPLLDVEEPDFQSWVDRIGGAIAKPATVTITKTTTTVGPPPTITLYGPGSGADINSTDHAKAMSANIVTGEPSVRVGDAADTTAETFIAAVNKGGEIVPPRTRTRSRTSTPVTE